MRRQTNIHSSYRGRRSAHEILITVAVVLGVLLLLVLGGLYLGQRYIVYTDEGIRLELPFFRGEDKQDTPVPPENLNIAEETERPAEPEPETPEEHLDPVVVPEEPEADHTTAEEVPLNAILDGTAGTDSTGAVIVTMKDREGKLGFVSQRPEAEKAQANSAAENVNQRLKAWNESQDYTIARVFCFADNSLPYHMNSLALRATYGNWRDLDQKRWLDPTNPASQDYVAALCGELAALGFDEILLEQAACPIDGNQEAIRWSNTNLTAAVSGTGGFLEKVRASVEEYGTKVSVRIGENVLAAEQPHGGLTVDGLNLYAHRIWAQPSNADLQEKMTAAGITDAENRMVEIVPELTQGTTTHQAKLLN